jgi:excisionase family DNA binding protein
MSASKTKGSPGRPRLPKPRPEPKAGRDDRERDVMTMREAAEYLNCAYTTVFRLAHRGEIPAFRLGGGWRCRLSDIDIWIAGRQVKPEARDGREDKRKGRPRKAGR